MNPSDHNRTGLLAHMVYFALHDRSEAAREQLLRACRTYLTNHPGILFFGCGTRDPELLREVNDRDFDVALQMIFRDRAAHDAYQVSPDHQRFIAENRANWRLVRVFDSVVTQAPTPA
jgi:hypothetical protein